MIHLPRSKQDCARVHIDGLANQVVTLPSDLAGQQDQLGGLALDILFFPDIGMVPESCMIAFGRFAPVQAVSWGHPDTTGLTSLDYFVSADAIEAPEADDYCTERLIRLNRLPCLYEPTDQPDPKKNSRVELGLPLSGTLYGCPQTLFKLHPEFDPILATPRRATQMGI